MVSLVAINKKHGFVSKHYHYLNHLGPINHELLPFTWPKGSRGTQFMIVTDLDSTRIQTFLSLYPLSQWDVSQSEPLIGQTIVNDNRSWP